MWAIVILGYISIPVVYAAYMFYLLHAGAFPAESDAIMIPIAGVTLLWLSIGILLGSMVVVWKIVRLVKGNR